VRLDPDVFTLGFARRATAYKRPDLFFHDVDRLNRIATAAGPLQLILAGKAHPQDEAGKTIIARIVKAKTSLGSRVALVYLQDYASLSVLDGWWIEGQTEGPQCEYQGLLVGQNLEQITLRLRRQLGPHLRASPDTDRYQRPP
jgi:glucan phosphorylase